MSDARAILRDVLVVWLVLALTAEHYDETEILATAAFAVLRTGFQMQFQHRPRWLNAAVVGALMLAVTVKCAHGIVEAHWLHTAMCPGGWQETWGQHVAKMDSYR